MVRRYLTEPLSKTTTKSPNGLAAFSVGGKTKTQELYNPKPFPREDRNAYWEYGVRKEGAQSLANPPRWIKPLNHILSQEESSGQLHLSGSQWKRDGSLKGLIKGTIYRGVDRVKGTHQGP